MFVVSSLLAAAAVAVPSCFLLLRRLLTRDPFAADLHLSATRDRGIVYLYQYPSFPSDFPVPNSSPFCLKLETFLRIFRIPYVVKPTINKSPKGKLPAIAFNGELISDSHFIIERLTMEFKLNEEAKETAKENEGEENTAAVATADHRRRRPVLNGGLSASQLSSGHALSIMTEQSLYFLLMHSRSICNDVNTINTCMMHIPAPLHKVLVHQFFIKNVKQILDAQGYGRHNKDEIVGLVRKDLIALSDALGDKPFFASYSASSSSSSSSSSKSESESVALVDIVVFAMIAEYYNTPLYSYADALITKEKPRFDNLAAFVERCKKKWWSDAWLLEDSKRGTAASVAAN